jgi:hypothetical protein
MAINSKEEANCKVALHAFAERNFSQWRGLPGKCSLSEVTSMFSLLNNGVGLARLGQRKANFMMLVVVGYTHPVRAWLEEGRIFMLDVEYPAVLPSLKNLLGELEEPTAKLDFFWGTLQLKQSEWVYSNRGLTLFINPDNNILLRLAAFSPTTMDAYEKDLRLDLYEREFPD